MLLKPFRDVNVHASASHYAFTSPSNPTAPTLVIDRPSGDIRLNDGVLLGSKRVSSVAGILGIIRLKLDKYAVVITKAEPMGRLRGHMVYRVVATEFFPLRERALHDPDEDKFLALLKRFLADGPMYFSYSIDLTNSFQRQAEADASQPLWQKADNRFFWNRFIQTDLIDFRIGGGRGGEHAGVDPYILPVMYGMLRIVQTRILSTALTFTLVTRRSRFRGGTRYLSRGMDEDGHVSNYNETEQIIILNDGIGGSGGFMSSPDSMLGQRALAGGGELQIMSYVQTRGSVPVYWAEVNTLRYTPKLQVRGIETAMEAARKHFDEQIQIYGDNYLVNLVNQKGREERVKKAYEQVVENLMSAPYEVTESDQFSREKLTTSTPSSKRRGFNRLRYIYFDFHNETKGLKWHRAQILLDQLQDGLVKGSYFRGREMPGDTEGALEVRSQQSAVVRTNCMDCLDRTNLVQSILGRSVLTRQLIDAGILKPGQSCSDDSAFEILFRNMWADNADVVSRSYSGTGALKTDFTRTGNRTRAGMIQDFKSSVTRYFRNNFLDGPRQDSFDLFLGAYLPPTSGFGNTIYADHQPILIQSIPYVFAASTFMVIISLLTTRAPDSVIWPLRLLMVVSLLIGAWSLHFIREHGMLYVNWPRLNTPAFAIEGYQEALNRASKDRLVGPFLTDVGKDQKFPVRNSSLSRMGYMEEGKKRTE